MRNHFLDTLFGSDHGTADIMWVKSAIPSFHMGTGSRNLILANSGPSFVLGSDNFSHPAGMTGGDKWKIKSSLHFLPWPWAHSSGPGGIFSNSAQKCNMSFSTSRSSKTSLSI